MQNFVTPLVHATVTFLYSVISVMTSLCTGAAYLRAGPCRQDGIPHSVEATFERTQFPLFCQSASLCLASCTVRIMYIISIRYWNHRFHWVSIFSAASNTPFITECGKNKSNENFKTAVSSNNYDRSKTTGKCGMF